MYVVRFNLLRPLGQLEMRKNRRYEYSEIAERSGLSRQTIRNVMKSPPNQINIETLAGLLTFFANEGMPISIDQLFDVRQVDDLDATEVTGDAAEIADC